MQPTPPARRRRRAGRAAGPPAPARTDPSPADRDAAAAGPVVPPAPPPADTHRPGLVPRTGASPAARVGPVETAGGGRWTGGSRRRSPREEQEERTLRSLVTLRGSQVSPSAALRAREVESPTAEDIAAAEQEVVVIRRNYVPPTALPTGRRSGRSRTAPDPRRSGGPTD